MLPTSSSISRLSSLCTRHLGAARHRELQQHHLLAVLRVQLEQALRRLNIRFPGCPWCSRADRRPAPPARAGSRAGAAPCAPATRRASNSIPIGKAPTRVVWSPYSTNISSRGGRAHPSTRSSAVEEVLGVAAYVEADQVTGEQGCRRSSRSQGSRRKMSNGRERGCGERRPSGVSRVRARRIFRRCHHQLIVVDPDQAPRPTAWLRGGRSAKRCVHFSS